MFAGLELSRRIERSEALNCSAFVDAHACARPDIGGCWIEIAGARCMFDGAASPATQTFGFGLTEPVTEEALTAAEAFFKDRGAPVYHEVSPLADPSFMELMNTRGYHPHEFSTVLVKPLDPAMPVPRLSCPVRLATPEESQHWAWLAAKGWDQPELTGLLEDLARTNALRTDTISLYAEVNGQLEATGALTIQGDIAMFVGASTVPEFRKRGAQQSLLAYRLYYASQHGCSLATMGALPGSASQRNAESNGFQVAYTRLKWKL